MQSQVVYARKKKKKTCELAIHFNCIKHETFDISFVVLEKITSQRDEAYNEIDCYSSEKPFGPHNHAHLILS